MAFSHSALRIVSGSALAPAAVLQKANDFILKDSSKGMFVTLFYLLINTNNRSFAYGCAGHNEQLYFDSATGELTLMKSHGIPLGILPNRTFQEIRKSYKPGDFIVLYTDGVLDAINDKREDYTLERLQRTILSSRKQSAAQIIEMIRLDVEHFCGDVHQFDDLTLMIIKFN
jgi:phosphoserine phosphatase RsbU/P